MVRHSPAVRLMLLAGATISALLAGCTEPHDPNLPVADCELRSMFDVVQEVPTLNVLVASHLCEMLTQWRGARPEGRVIQAAGKASFLLHYAGVTDTDAEILTDLMEIADLRGAATGEETISAWNTTLKIFQVSEGRVQPRRLAAFLAASGPLARTLSEEGLGALTSIIAKQPLRARGPR
jgi:hypothetical protein